MLSFCDLGTLVGDFGAKGRIILRIAQEARSLKCYTKSNQSKQGKFKELGLLIIFILVFWEYLCLMC